MDPRLSDLVEMIPKVDEPLEQSTKEKVADPGEMPPEDAIQVGQFQTGVEAPDREFLKSEAIFLLPPEPGKRQYLVMQFSDAQGKRFECQFLLPRGDYQEMIAKAMRRLFPINPFPPRPKS